METLVAAADHRNYHGYYGRSNGRGGIELNSFGSFTSEKFSGMNCRSFQSGVGLLPTPVKSFSTPSSKKVSSAVHSYETPSPSVNENLDCSKGNVGSRIIPIAIKINFENEESGFCYSELWAGPAYSNSPPPSSLPLPNFFLQPKGTCSLDLRTLSSEIREKPIAKYAPAYPRRYRFPSPADPFDRDEYATKTLRRILHLDLSDI